MPALKLAVGFVSSRPKEALLGLHRWSSPCGTRPYPKPIAFFDYNALVVLVRAVVLRQELC